MSVSSNPDASAKNQATCSPNSLFSIGYIYICSGIIIVIGSTLIEINVLESGSAMMIAGRTMMISLMIAVKTTYALGVALTAAGIIFNGLRIIEVKIGAIFDAMAVINNKNNVGCEQP